ncbi:MAG TPA: response regulator [Candidatus Saccharimonadia bacterium]|nr:response regulator [Candidatus Saccharimonadia bacterium]
MASVLIVDDDPLLSRLYSRTLTHEGFIVEVAENGQEGLEKAKAFQPDIILLDIMMPKLNGIDTLTNLKANAQTKKIPVVMLTNLADSHTKSRTLEQGAVHYIIKTKHSPAAIAVLLKEVLNKRSESSNGVI